jgi:hypothetical protein
MSPMMTSIIPRQYPFSLYPGSPGHYNRYTLAINLVISHHLYQEKKLVARLPAPIISSTTHSMAMSSNMPPSYPHLRPPIKTSWPGAFLYSSPRSYIQDSGPHPVGLCDVLYFTSFMSFFMLLNEHIPTIRFTELQQYDLFQVLYNYITASLRFHVSLDRTPLR